MSQRIGDFKAFPKRFSGKAAGGTVEAPGFHTAIEPGITYPYAYMKVMDILPDTWDAEDRVNIRRHGLHDAPVVVSLDMAGLVPHPDIDAKFALENFEFVFDEFKKEADRNGDLLEQFLDFVDSWDTYPENEEPGGVDELLFEVSGVGTEAVLYSVKNYLEGLNPILAQRILDLALRNRPDEYLLMNGIGQFRYLEDVPSERIMGVKVLAPWFNRIFPHYEDEDYDKKMVESIESAGFETASLENWYDQTPPISRVFSWDRPPSSQRQLWFPGIEETPALEYHGTSLLNLVLAAPELEPIADEIPPPFKAASFRKALDKMRRER